MTASRFKALVNGAISSWRRATLFTRLLATGIILVLLMGGLFWASSNYVFTLEMKKRLGEVLSHDLRLAWAFYYERPNQMRLGMAQAAIEPHVKLLIRERERDELKELMRLWKQQRPYVDIWLIADGEGRVIARHNSDLTDDRVLFNSLMEKAFMSERNAEISTEILSHPEMAAERIPDDIPAADEGVMAALVAVPVRDAGEVIGVIVTGDVINGDPYIPSRAYQEPTGEPYKGPKIQAFEPQIVICQGTKVITPPGSWGQDCGVGTGGELPDGHTHHVHDFIKNNKGEVIGYITVSVPETAISDIRRPILKFIMVFALLGILLGVLATYHNAKMISKPVKKPMDAFKRVAEWDLSYRISEAFHGELGQLARAFDAMAARLESSHKRLFTYNMALDSAGDAVLLKDTDDRVIYANPAFETLTGRSAGKMRGERFYVHEMSQFPEAVKREIDRELEANGHWAGELGRVALDGRELELRASISRVSDDKGEHLGYVVILMDLTEKKRMERQLARADRLSLIGKMAASIIHEVKNPLNIISMQAQLLAMQPALKGHEEALKTIRAQAERAASVLDRLRRLSRQEKIVRTPQDISSVVEDALRTLDPLLKRSRIRVEKSLPGLGSVVLVSKEQLEQVLVNLCTNARDAMPEGGTLFISTGISDDRNCFVRVADTGCGIPEKKLENIFDPFYTTKPPEKGTGIGLAIVASIVREHGGRIKAESTAGKGTTFTLYLPLLDESISEFERDMEFLVGSEKEVERSYAELAERVEDPALRELLRELAEDERKHAKGLEQLLEESRRSQYAKLPPSLRSFETGPLFPPFDPQKVTVDDILEAVTEVETSRLNTFYYMVLCHFDKRSQADELLNGHLNRVMEGVSRLSRRLDLVDRLKRYRDTIDHMAAAIFFSGQGPLT